MRRYISHLGGFLSALLGTSIMPVEAPMFGPFIPSREAPTPRARFGHNRTLFRSKPYPYNSTKRGW